MSHLPDRFPRGWFVLGHQREFLPNATKAIYAFNRKISVTRDSNGEITVETGDSHPWPVLEINQMVLIWHDIEKQEPDLSK